MVTELTARLVARRLAAKGDLVVIAVAVPFGSGLSANTLHLHRV